MCSFLRVGSLVLLQFDFLIVRVSGKIASHDAPVTGQRIFLESMRLRAERNEGCELAINIWPYLAFVAANT